MIDPITNALDITESVRLDFARSEVGTARRERIKASMIENLTRLQHAMDMLAERHENPENLFGAKSCLQATIDELEAI